MKFSVIVSNFNYAHFIRETIDSVIQQTYSNWELIIVDDGSTDNSVDILRYYKEQYPEKIKIISKENGGQASGFNRGFTEATGDIVAFLDADDYWYPNKLETILPHHKKNLGVQHNLLVNGKRKYVFLKDQSTTTRKSFIEYGYTGAISTSGLSYDREQLKNYVMPIPEEEFRICADSYVRSIFLVHQNIISLDEPLGYYRAHSQNNFFNNKQDHLGLIAKATNLALAQYNELFGDSKVLIGQEYVYAKRMYQSLNISPQDGYRYIIYGTGYAGKHYYRELLGNNIIVAFASTNPAEEYLEDIPVWDIASLKSNEVAYDKILIASQQMVEIYSYLLDNKIDGKKVVYPEM